VCDVALAGTFSSSGAALQRRLEACEAEKTALELEIKTLRQTLRRVEVILAMLCCAMLSL
jgi:cell division protein FtsB